jgi:hypothetical protein
MDAADEQPSRTIRLTNEASPARFDLNIMTITP